MKKKMSIMLVVMLTVILMNVSTSVLDFYFVKATPGTTIYIRYDGSVDPPTAPIQRDGSMYTFANDIYYPTYEGIIVEKSSITIDGNGHTLQGSGEIGTYGFDLTSISNVIITDTNIRDFNYGIWLDSSSSITISEDTITDNSYGVFMVGSSNNDVSGNNITSNDSDGVSLHEYSDFNIISGNNLSDNTQGIYLQDCSHTTVSDNILWNYLLGIWCLRGSYNNIYENSILYNGDCGIWLESSHHNTIFGHYDLPNVIAASDAGIALTDGASDNTLFENWILACNFGIFLRDASNNKFYHNRFYTYVYDQSWDNPEIPPSVNTWDDGYPSGGNHWYSHTKVDEYHGSDQDQLGGDGIADIPYVIDENNEDRYPLTLTSAYGARIKAVSDFSPASVDITKDSVPTGHTTEHYFGDLKGTHWFTVPDRDPFGHPFKEWNTGETSTTIKITSAGTYTAYYEAGVIDMAFGSPPTVDGSISAGEYIDANSVTFATSGGTCTVYFKHDGTALYVAFNVPNVELNGAVQVFVDTEYDQADAPQTDDYQFTITIGGELWESQGTGTDWGPSGPPEDWTGAHQVFTSIWSAEFAIAYEKLGITAGVSKTIGISFWNAWTLTGHHHWPTTIADWLDTSTWSAASSHNSWTLPVPCAWTCLAYLDADIDFEYFEVNQFLEMAAVGSTEGVNIVVQMDRQGFGGLWDDWRYDDWTGCKRYLVTYNMTPTIANALQTLGEVNMGDPNTLANFVAWGILNYPADHYLLVFLDHGGGWKGVCVDGTSDMDLLTPSELEQAFAAVESAVGVKIDIVGFDACLMGMIDVAYQIKDYADIMVASEEVEPANLPGGWPYDCILGNLTSNPMMVPSELASQIVTSYIDSYSNSPHSYANKTTMSAINLGLVPYPTVDDLATVTSYFAQELMNALPNYRNDITQARNQTEEYYYPTYVDLYHFAEQIYTLVSDPDIQTAAEQVMNTLTDSVIAEEHRWEHPNSHGLSIYFPKTAEDYELSYENLAFATHTKWDEFLNLYYGVYAEIHVQIGEETYTITIRSNVTLTDVTANKANLSFNVSGTSGQTGYVNATMPLGLNQTEIEVFIDGEPITPPFPTITTNGTHYFIYFEFTFSTHDITIQYAIADVATTNITSSKTVVGQGYCTNLTVTVKNLGSYAETFDITAYYNTTIMETKAVTNLQPNEETTVTFTWNTTDFALGNYTLSAYATPVSGETDTEDNTFIDGWVFITIPGDVNGDFKVDGKDIACIAKAYNTKSGNPLWDPDADINSDNKVDGKDVAIVAKYYDTHYP